MMHENKLLFSTLTTSQTPWQRWVCSGCVHIALIAALILIPLAVREAVAPQQRVSRVTLYSPPVVKPYKPVQVRMPQLPKPRIAAIKPVPIPVNVPEPKVAPPIRKQAALPVVTPKKVEVATMEPPRLELPAPAPAASLPGSHISPLPAVKVGGFGDPNGAKPTDSPQTSALTVAKAGGFDMPAGQGAGSGLGSGKGIAMAGFGSGYGTEGGKGTGGNGTGVRSAGFGSFEGAPQVTRASAPSKPAETPVNVIWKPKPAYTEEAREKKIEGDVQLEVLFEANGQIVVLRLVHGLGHGLDENAKIAASQIRFRPGTRDGSPVDTKATVHIQFALS